MGIGDRIKARRTEIGITQEELAERLGYKSRSSINKIELGITDVSQSRIEDFAKALHTNIGYLLGLTDPVPATTLEYEGMEVSLGNPALAELNRKLSKLDEPDLAKVEGYVDALLCDEKYNEKKSAV